MEETTQAIQNTAQVAAAAGTHPAEIGLFLGACISALSVAAAGLLWPVGETKRRRLWWWCTLPCWLIPALLAWLWMPWVTVFLHWAATSSVNAAKSEDPPPQVIPADREIIDLREKKGGE